MRFSRAGVRIVKPNHVPMKIMRLLPRCAAMIDANCRLDRIATVGPATEYRKLFDDIVVRVAHD